MQIVLGLALLASAFAPVVGISAIASAGGSNCTSWAILGVCALFGTFPLLVIKRIQTLQTDVIQTTNVCPADERVLAFTTTYLIAPVTAAVLKPGEFWSSGLTIVFIAFVYIRGGLYYLNPSLALLGYRLFEVTTDNGSKLMVLSKRRHLPQKGLIIVRHFSNNSAIQEIEHEL